MLTLLFGPWRPLRCLPACFAATLILCSRPVSAAAQVNSSTWLWGWSSLAPFGDLGRPAPVRPELPRLLDLPAPRIGLAWNAGNPAALAEEVDSTWTELSVGASGVGGDYHMPLDARRSSGRGMSLAGWRQLGGRRRSSAIGRVSIDTRAVGARGTYAAFATPGRSTPFAPADTNRPALQRSTVTLEGGEGIAFGSWSAGIDAGYQAIDNRGEQSAIAFLGRASAAAIGAGVTRSLGEHLRAGLSFRHRRGSETVSLAANPRTLRVYPLDGYVNVEPLDLPVTTPPYRRRADRAGNLVSAGIAGATVGTSWLAYAQAFTSNEDQFSSINADPPTDRWRTSGYVTGVTAQRRLFGLLGSMRADWTSQTGRATRSANASRPLTADASRFVFEGDVRKSPVTSRWSAGALVTVRRDHEMLADEQARARTDISAWTLGGSAELVRQLGGRGALAVGYGLTEYYPVASLPEPTNRGAMYQAFIAPGIELSAAAAKSEQLGFTAQWRIAGSSVALRVWRSITAPTRRPFVYIPLPRGSRVSWGVTLSVAGARQ